MIRNRTTRRVARTVGAAAGLTSLLVGLAAPGAQAATPPPAQDTDAFCVNVPEGNAFGDLSGNEANINCLAFTEITTGKTPTSYAPGDPVTRGQMATFIARMIDTANELELVDLPELPASGADAFTDDNGIAPHEANINRLAAVGVVAGVGGGLFAPNQPVSRAQMATFINNAQAFLSGTNTRLTSPDDFFTDDDNQTAHQANINGLAGNGIVQGGPGGISQTLYGPDLPVNRSQMASFIIRYLGLAESLGTIEAPGEPATNVSIAVSPLTAETKTHDGAVASNTPDDDRTFTASGLTAGTTYRVALFTPADIALDGAIVSFLDVDGTPNVADGSAGTNAVASIVKVNNADVAAAPAVDAVPVSGTITVTIDGFATGHVFPVIWEDADADALLDLNANDEPTEAFGVGGNTTYLPAEAPGGAIAPNPSVITYVDKDANLFVASGKLYNYDATGDTFTVDGAPANLAAFEAVLSAGDEIAGTYADDPALASAFALDNLNPDPPTGVAVVQTAEGAEVTWVAPVTGEVDSYNVYRAVSANNTDCTTTTPAAYSAVGSAVASGTLKFVDTTATVPEQYCYQVASVNDGDEGDLEPAPGVFADLVVIDASAPTIVFVAATTDGGTVGVLDGADVVDFVFSEPMAASTAADGSLFRVGDADGTIFDIVCAGDGGGTDSCLLNVAPTTVNGTEYPVGQVMRVVIGNATLTQINAGVAGLNLPLAITNVSAGWDDLAGIQLDLVNSADKSI